MKRGSKKSTLSSTVAQPILFVSQRNVQPPCQAACPAGVRVRDYIALIAQGRYRDADSLIRERMPFSSACGRICYQPCEAECNRALVDEPVAIMYLKRFISDYAYQAKLPLPNPIPKTRAEKIAIVGAGPSGLTAAQDLAKLAYSVTVFESSPFPGGTLRAALPLYRLPKKLVDWDIENILALGIKLNTNTALGKGFSLKELREEDYSAILIATGADRSRKLSQPEIGVFAIGDSSFGPMWTVHAVAAGHQGAVSVDNYLQGKSTMPAKANHALVAKREKGDLEEKVRQGHIKLKPRAAMPLWGPLESIHDLVEMELGYSEEVALQEAQRCLGCGAAEILEAKCTACLTCVRLCPYEVPAITPLNTVEVRIERCQACGVCVGECPARAIAFTMPGIEDLIPQIEAALEAKPASKTEPTIIGFYCSYWAKAGPELIKQRFPNIRMIPLLCIAKVDTLHLLKAFEAGAHGVFLAGCEEEDCSYQKGIFWARHRVDSTKKILAEIGLEKERLEIYNSPTSGLEQLAGLATEFTQRIKQLTPSPLKNRRQSNDRRKTKATV